MRFWLGLGLAATLTVTGIVSGCRGRKTAARRDGGRAVATATPRIQSPAVHTRSNAAYAARPPRADTGRVVASSSRVPAVSLAEWQTPTPARNNGATPTVRTAAAHPPPGFSFLSDQPHPARTSAPAEARRDLAAATGMARYPQTPASRAGTPPPIPATPALAEAPRTVAGATPAALSATASSRRLPTPDRGLLMAGTNTPSSRSAAERRLMETRQVMSMARPATGYDANGALPRAEVTYVAAGAVPAALRSNRSMATANVAEAERARWTTKELPVFGGPRPFLVPLPPVNDGATASRPTTAGSLWAAR